MRLIGTAYFVLVLCVLFFLLPRETTLYIAATGVGAWFWAYILHPKSPNLWATLKVILVIGSVVGVFSRLGWPAGVGYLVLILPLFFTAINAFTGPGGSLIRQGYSLYLLQRYEEALAAYDQAIKRAPSNGMFAGMFADYHSYRGSALQELKRHQEALDAYEHALQLNPNYADAYNGKGNALWSLERSEEALVAYERAIQLNPNNGMFHNNKGLLLKTMSRLAEAEQAFKKAQELGYKG